MKTLGVVVVVVVCLVGLMVLGFALNWFGEATNVAQKEFGPNAMLQKYEWFINQANGIEKMDRDIVLFEGRVKGVDDQYKGYGSDMSKWPPHIQVQYNSARQQARDDLVAIASQRNNLVKEYNAQSEKFNWKPFQSDPRKPKERFHEYIV
jgi:hypothetical protein